MILRALIAFISGAAVELACVFWCANAAKGDARRTALWSMVIATSQLLGIGEGLTGFLVGASYVLGFGTGSYLGVLISKRRGRGGHP